MVRAILNVIWLVFCGVWMAICYVLAGLVCFVLIITIPFGIAAFRIADPAPVEELRVRTFDTFQLIDPRVKTARPDTILAIDERSLAKLGQWPWPRTRIADLVANYNLTQSYVPTAAPSLTIQGTGGIRKTIEAGIEAVEELLPMANAISRTPQPLSELMVAP